MSLRFADQDVTPLLTALGVLGAGGRVSLDVHGDKLVAEGTDGAVRVVWSAPLARPGESEEGQITVEAKALHHHLKGAQVVSLRDNGRGRAEYHRGPLKGWLPLQVDRVDLLLDQLHTLSEEQAFDAAALQDAVACVAVFRDDTRAVTRPGIHTPFLVEDGVFATDGMGVQWAKLPYSGPKRQLGWQLATLPLDREGAVGLAWGAGHLRVEQANTTWYLPLLVLGTDDDVENLARTELVPQARLGPQTFVADAAELRAAAKQLRSLSGAMALALLVFDSELLLETPLDRDNGASIRLPLRDVVGDLPGVAHIGLPILLSALPCHTGNIAFHRPAPGSGHPWLLESDTGRSLFMPILTGGTP